MPLKSVHYPAKGTYSSEFSEQCNTDIREILLLLVCLCVCVYVCACVCMCVCVCVCVCVSFTRGMANN